MKIEYHNLYTHFILITSHRLPLIQEKHRIRIEKYITGIVNNNQSKLYAIYANPEHVHFLASRSPKMSEELLATIVAESSERFINGINFASANSPGRNPVLRFLCQNRMSIKYVNISLTNPSIIKRFLSGTNMIISSGIMKQAYDGILVKSVRWCF